MGFVYKDITVEQRVQVGLIATLQEGQYGMVSDLARGLGTSRKFIYELRERVRTAVATALAPRPAGPTAAKHAIVVDRPRLERGIVTLSLVGKASERAIGDCLKEMYAVEPSLGYINGVLARASKGAAAFNEGLPLVLKEAQLEADELFALGKANLVAVEPRSLLIVALRQAKHCDEAAWQEVLTALQDSGVDLARLGSDGGKALAAAVKGLAGVEQQLDCWHALRHIGRAERVVEKVAYVAIAEEEELAGKAEKMDPGHAMGGYIWQRLRETRGETAQKIAQYDQFHTVCRWAREALEAIDPLSGRLRSQPACLADLRAASELLCSLKVEGGRQLASYLAAAGPGLLHYVERLRAPLAALAVLLGEEGLRLLCREWRLRQEVGKARRWQKGEQKRVYQQAHLLALLHWGADYRRARDCVVAVLEGVMRGSSLAECVNSWLRPYADLMKGLGERFLPLFQLYRNSHVFARGKRAGHAPLELAGIPTPPGNWLDWLGLGRQQQLCRSVRSLPKQHTPKVAPAMLPAT